MKNILLVENDDMSINVILFFLKNDYKVDVAKDGITALQMIKEKKYSAILMDIDLGVGMNGLEIANRINEFPEYKNVPVVAVTAYAFQRDKENFLAQGCTHYISKPFKKDELIILLKNII